jgi:Ca2+-transporting ATPase
MTGFDANSSFEAPWARSGQEILEALGVPGTEGLDGEQARRRRREHGPNRLRSAKRSSAWAILIDQFKSVLIALLVVGAALWWPGLASWAAETFCL